VKASRREMTFGCASRRRIATSRSTRFAWSGDASTSGMRLMATCANSASAGLAAATECSAVLETTEREEQALQQGDLNVVGYAF
jgi:hypothetical protein